MIDPGLHQFRVFGLAVALALESLREDRCVEDLPEVSAEDIWLAEGRCARFGHPLPACGRLPVPVAGVACLVTLHEVRRYYSEFLQIPCAL